MNTSLSSVLGQSAKVSAVVVLSDGETWDYSAGCKLYIVPQEQLGVDINDAKDFQPLAVLDLGKFDFTMR